MKYSLILCFVFLSVISCNVNDLYHAVDEYAFLVRLADLTKAVIDDSHSIDWAALQQLQLRYHVDLVEPTNRFLVAADELKRAYTELHESIAREERNIAAIRALSEALYKLDEDE